MKIYIDVIHENFSSERTIYRTCLGRYHREDGPAIIWKNGKKEWFRHGLHHREDGPAIEYPNGGKEWWVNGKRHREDGPAIEWYDGTKYYYLHSELYAEYYYWQEIARIKFGDFV